jgi:two-component system, chemotaxis family, CheB/CheR fusion protein
MTDQTPPQTGDLVVIGSSAGGIEALSIVAATFPLDFPAPIVIAQHLDPKRPSGLGSVLRRQTQLPVEEVDGDCQMKAGTIYIVPSDRHVIISDSHVVIEDPLLPERPRPSIDLLIATAATAYEDRLYVVILTGRGSDGAAGAAQAKQAGGTIIVQDPATARYPSMPLALSPSIIDFRVDLEQIGSLLYKLLTGIAVSQEKLADEDILQTILSEVSRQTSIDFRPYKKTSLLRRISRRMASLQIQLLGEYAEYIKAHTEEATALVNTLLINVTEFFRDPEAFYYLKTEILPVLIERASAKNRVLRFWCAGCATGEEPYSVAMLLVDLLGEEIIHWSIKIFATDLDEAAITFARHGLYTEPLLKNVPVEYRERFFHWTDGNYRIARAIRQLVTFGQQDLSHSGPFPRIDLVLCRNVLIYFNTQLQATVLNNFAFALFPDGYLFVGKAETVRPSQSNYELLNKSWKIYRCIGLPSQVSRRLGSGSTNASKTPPSLLQLNIGMENTKVPQTEYVQLRRMNELLLRFLPLGIVVIDRGYRLVTANTTVRRLLGLHESGEGMDFLHSVRGIPYEPLRSAIDRAFRERTMVFLPELELNPKIGGTGRYISFTITPMQMDQTSQELAAISISDVTDQVTMREKLETAQNEQMRLLEELNTLNRQLTERNKELVDSNEELQVSNEELILAQEELQATVEEYETTNEELQAANEELETTNEETQAINEELQATNDEFRARTQELQDLAVVLESDQRQLQELSRQLLNAQEVEKRSIAGELHDEIGQELTAIQMRLGTLKETKNTTSIEAAMGLVTSLVGKIRNLALDLRPAMIDDFGLLPTLVAHFRRYTEQTAIAVQFRHNDIDRRFPPEVEITAYRIVQESLTNVARHAGVKAVTVNLWIENNRLYLQIEDDGAGFDPSKTIDSFGLRGMRERAKLLDADLKIRSAQGQGTHISASFPLQQDDSTEKPDNG